MNKINHPENYEELIGNFSATYCESPCPPRKTFHIHEAFELMLMLSEGAELLVNNEAYPVPKGSLLMFGPTDLHLIRYSGKENYKRFVVWFKEEFLRELEPILGDLLKCFYIRRSQKENLITLTYDNFKRFYDIFSRLTECKSSSTLIQKLTLGELLASTNELKSNTQIEVSGEVEYADVYFAMRYIQENISKKILQDELAKCTGRNKRSLCADFIAVTGMSTGQYILNCRITAAKAYLVQGLSVSSACEKTGFENWSNFSRTFKNHVGISPKQYSMTYRK